MIGGQVATTDDGATRLVPVRTRPTRRLLVVPPLGLLLFAAGQNVGAGYLLVLAGGLLAAGPWAWWAVRRSARTVEVRRRLPATATAGEAVEVVLHVRADAGGALVVRDELTGTVGVVEDPRPGGELRARVALPRGAATGGEVTAEVSDPLGLVRATVSGRVPGRVEVLPGAVRADVRGVADLAGARADSELRPAGEGAQTDGTREYRSGDPVRAVHWRSSARRDELVVRRLVGEAAGRLRLRVEPGAWDAASLDTACLAVAAAADGAAAAGVAVELELGRVVLPWTGASGPRVLAHLRPNLDGAPGDGSPDPEAPGLASARDRDAVRPPDVEVALRAVAGVDRVDGAGGVAVDLAAGGTRTTVGVLPSSRDAAQVRAWVEEHLGRHSPVRGG